MADECQGTGVKPPCQMIYGCQILLVYFYLIVFVVLTHCSNSDKISSKPIEDNFGVVKLVVKIV